MAASDSEQEGTAPEKLSPDREKRKEHSDASSSPRHSKHHYSRSRSRSRERKKKDNDGKKYRSRSRSKENNPDEVQNSILRLDASRSHIKGRS